MFASKYHLNGSPFKPDSHVFSMLGFLKVFIIACVFSSHIVVVGQDNYPVPKESPNRLFYIQHSYNHNTYVYDARMNGTLLDPKDPVEEYRIVYTEGGERKPLTPIQKKMAYGTTVYYVGKNLFQVTLAASKELVFYLHQKPDEAPRVYVVVNNRKMYLDRMFLELGDKLTSFSIKAEYILLEGTDYATGKKVTEKFIPKD